MAVYWCTSVHFEARSGSVLRRNLTWGAHGCPGCGVRGLPRPVEVTAPHSESLLGMCSWAHSRGVTLRRGQMDRARLRDSSARFCTLFLGGSFLPHIPFCKVQSVCPPARSPTTRAHYASSRSLFPIRDLPRGFLLFPGPCVGNTQASQLLACPELTLSPRYVMAIACSERMWGSAGRNPKAAPRYLLCFLRTRHISLCLF